MTEYQTADIRFAQNEWQIYVASTEARSRDAPAGWGCVVVSLTNEEIIAQGVIPSGGDERSRAELLAVIRGLRCVPEGAAAILVTDNAYLKNGLSFQNRHFIGVQTDNPLDVTSLWAQLFALMDKRTVRLSEFGLVSAKHKARALSLAQEASVAAEEGVMPLSTSSFTEFEAAGSPGSMTISPSGCGTIIAVAICGGIVASILSWLLSVIFGKS